MLSWRRISPFVQPIRRRNHTLVGLILTLAVLSACRKPPEGPGECSLLLSPTPGFYHQTVSVAIASTRSPIRFYLSSSSLRDAPVTLPSQGSTVSSPSFYRTYSAPLSLTEGYHRLAIEDPCGSGWKEYFYLVDETPPLLYLSPSPGSYRTPITIQVFVNDPGALVFARFYPVNDPPPPFDPQPDRKIFLFKDGTYRVEVRAQDPVGNSSLPVSGEYTIDTSSATLLEFQLFSDPASASPLPLLRARFDQPMDSTINLLPQAVSYTNGGDPPVDLLLFWRSSFEVDMLPAKRLREGASVEANITGIRSFTGGRIFEPSTPSPRLPFRICSGCILEPFSITHHLESYFLPLTQTALTFTVEVHPQGIPPSFQILAQSPSRMTDTNPEGTTAPMTSVTPLGGGRYEITISTDWVSAGESFRIILIGNRIQGFPYALLLHLLKGGDPSSPPLTSPAPLTGFPSQAITNPVPWGELWIQSTVPLNPKSVQENATLTVNGSPQSFYAIPLDLASPTTLRIVPTFPFRGNDAVHFTLPTSATDLWGRNITQESSLSFIVASYPGGFNPPSLLWGFDRDPGSKVYLSSLRPILSGWVEPHVESLEVVVRDLETMRPVDGFFVELFPRWFLEFSNRSRSYFVIASEPWLPTLPPGRILRVEITPRVNPDLRLYAGMQMITLTTALSPAEEPLTPLFTLPGLLGAPATRSDGVFLDSYFLPLMNSIATPLTGAMEVLDGSGRPITTLPLAPVTVATLLDAVTHPGFTRGQPEITLNLSRPSTDPPFLGELILQFVCIRGDGNPEIGPTTDSTCLSNKPYLRYSFDQGASWSQTYPVTLPVIELPHSLDLHLADQSPPPQFEGPTTDLPGEEFHFLLWTNTYAFYQPGNSLLSPNAPFPITAFPESGLMHFSLGGIPTQRSTWSRPYDRLPTQAIPEPITPPSEFTAPVTQGILFEWAVTDPSLLDAILLVLSTPASPSPWFITLPPNSTMFFLEPYLCPPILCRGSGSSFQWTVMGLRTSGIPAILYGVDLNASYATYYRGLTVAYPPRIIHIP